MAECFCFVRVLAVLDINIYSCPTSNVFFLLLLCIFFVSQENTQMIMSEPVDLWTLSRLASLPYLHFIP